AQNESGKRVALQVQLSEGTNASSPVNVPKNSLGKTRDETRDTNDFLEAVLKKGQTYQIEATDTEGTKIAWEFQTTAEVQQMIEWKWKSSAAALIDKQ
ncbi:MAG: hypothetical protein WCO86_06550, partial [Planctomycetota bacterium]